MHNAATRTPASVISSLGHRHLKQLGLESTIGERTPTNARHQLWDAEQARAGGSGGCCFTRNPQWRAFGPLLLHICGTMVHLVMAASGVHEEAARKGFITTKKVLCPSRTPALDRSLSCSRSHRRSLSAIAEESHRFARVNRRLSLPCALELVRFGDAQLYFQQVALERPLPLPPPASYRDEIRVLRNVWFLSCTQQVCRASALVSNNTAPFDRAPGISLR